MRIGVITFWKTEDNYGQVLQCYALLHYLNAKGHQAFLVRTSKKEYKPSFIHKCYTFFSLLRKSPLSLLHIKSSRKMAKPPRTVIDRGFKAFKEKYIPCTNVIYSYEDLCREPLKVDMMICGSDQIWGAISELMYLQLPGHFKRIAYAASFGGYQIDNPIDKRKVWKWLESFDLITVREKDGIKACRDLGAESYEVIDPTLLLGRSDYMSISKKYIPQTSKPYILLYLLGNPIPMEIDEVYEMAQELQMDVKYVASQGREDEYNKTYPTIEEWLSMMENASYVVTNSYHGTIFSMLYNKPFLTVPLVGNTARMNSRIMDLLKRYHLEHRLYQGNIRAVITPVDYSAFNEEVEEERAFASRLLEPYLES